MAVSQPILRRTVGAFLLIATVGAVAFGVSRALEPMAWDPRLEPYVAFVEEARALEFTEPVTVRQTDVAAALRADAGAADAAYAEEFGDGGEFVDVESIAFELLGLIAPRDTTEGTDLADDRAEVQAASSAAFYDSQTKEIVIPPGDVTPWMASVIVHELTHALQDQHGLLDYAPWTVDDALMQRALTEGDADRVEAAWYHAQDTQTQVAIDEVYANVEAAPSTFLDATFAAPYLLGDPFVARTVAIDGPERLEFMQRDGAGSTERLIDPRSDTPRPAKAKDRYATLEGTTDDDIVGGGTVGALGLYQLLAPETGHEAALVAVQGYDFDDYVVTYESDRYCMALAVWVDSAEDAEELQAAIRSLGPTATTADRGVPAAPSVQFSICEGDAPLTSPEAQSVESLLPLQEALWGEVPQP